MAELVVITGIGGMGLACARRLVQGRTLVLIDIDGARLAAASEALSLAGYDVVTEQADVADADAIRAIAQRAADRGTIRALVHTAGISGTMGTADRIFDVNLRGTANVIDAFEPVIASGGAAVCIASMGAIAIPVAPEIEQRFANAPTDELVAIANGIRSFHPVEAYCLSKRANQLRVSAAAIRWGRRDARINSVSPGIIATPMARAEEAAVPAMAVMRRISPIQRIGTPEDIAGAAEFLLGPNASFITGSDLAVDGGVIAAQRYGGELAF
jgi:NAD(P)-dependent dehydrogenase (short-subunit alcohol dehydrogenase family)